MAVAVTTNGSVVAWSSPAATADRRPTAGA